MGTEKMRRAAISSSDASFAGGLISTHFHRGVEFFFENAMLHVKINIVINSQLEAATWSTSGLVLPPTSSFRYTALDGVGAIETWTYELFTDATYMTLYASGSLASTATTVSVAVQPYWIRYHLTLTNPLGSGSGSIDEAVGLTPESNFPAGQPNRLAAVKFTGETFSNLTAGSGTNSFFSKEGTFSCWFRLTGEPQKMWIFKIRVVNAFIGAQLDDNGALKLWGREGNDGQDLEVMGPVIADAGWHHVVFSWNTATDTAQLMLDGENAIQQYWMTADASFEWSEPDLYIGSWGSRQYFIGDLGDLWLYSKFMDVETNISKFLQFDHPAYLGATGERPSQQQPELYLSGHEDNWTAGKNFGKWSDLSKEQGQFERSDTVPRLAS